MADSDATLEQLKRYGRVARNSQMLLVMDPSESGLPAAEEARDAIADDALTYLSEVEEGIESPYFAAYSRQDKRFIDHLAAQKVRQAEWDRWGIFEIGEPRIRTADSSQAQAATFAYLAASCMRQFKAPFYLAPGLRTGVRSPHNLAEFVATVGTVKQVTKQARDGRFYNVAVRDDWRVAFVFWESAKWLSQSLRVGRTS